MKYLICIIAICLVHNLYSQKSTYTSLAEAGSCLSGISAIHSNPAGIIDGVKISMSLDHRQVGIENLLSESSMGTVYSGENFALALMLQQLGDHRLAIRKYQFSYAKQFGPNLKMGLSAAIHEWDFSDIYARKYALGNSVGIQYKYSSHIDLGLMLQNPIVKRVFDATNEKLNSALSVGINYSPNEKFTLLLEQEFNSLFGSETKTAFEYSPRDKLCIRAGYQLESRRLSLGFGTEFNKWSSHFAMVYHSITGLSGSIGIICQIQ